jgi:perosamine synthetase
VKVPLAKPYFTRAEAAAVNKVLESGWVAQGPKVAEFEEAVRQFTGAGFARATSSCTTALHLALLALGIGPGDEVIVPSFTFVASANAIEHTGARPVFVDIDPKTFCIDPRRVEECLRWRSDKVKCIMPVHLFGLCADMGPIIGQQQRYSIPVIEDAACALGSTYYSGYAGTFGDIGCFSFHPRKLITTGEGGMLVTNDPDIADSVSSLRDHGVDVSSSKRHERGDYSPPSFNALGYNYRMSDIHAAIGLEQMKKLPWIIDMRVEIAKRYNAGLQDLECLQTPYAPKRYGHTYQSYVITLNSNEARDIMMAKLTEKGIGTRQGTSAVHLLGYYRRKYRLESNDFPASYLADHLTLALPMYPQMTDAEQDYVIESVRQIAKSQGGTR